MRKRYWSGGAWVLPFKMFCTSPAIEEMLDNSWWIIAPDWHANDNRLAPTQPPGA